MEHHAQLRPAQSCTPKNNPRRPPSVHTRPRNISRGSSDGLACQREQEHSSRGTHLRPAAAPRPPTFSPALARPPARSTCTGPTACAVRTTERPSTNVARCIAREICIGRQEHGLSGVWSALRLMQSTAAYRVISWAAYANIRAAPRGHMPSSVLVSIGRRATRHWAVLGTTTRRAQAGGWHCLPRAFVVSSETPPLVSRPGRRESPAQPK